MTNQSTDINIERYKSIKSSFIESVIFKNNDIYIDELKIDRLDKAIPSFIKKLDNITHEMSEFYNEIQFPNYDEFDDYASLCDKGVRNLFTKRLDDELGCGKKILELGCGTGQLSLFLSNSNRQIFGVDISDGSLILGENFRRKYKIENTYFMKMDVFDLKFKPNTFDAIISNGVLHHTKNAEESFRCLVNVAKPGGLIVIGLYHRYGRIFTKLKQKIAKIIGEKIFYFDRTSRRIKGKEKRSAWIKDQFMNPNETSHTPNEVMGWFDDNNVEFLNLIPHYSIENSKLFTRNKKPKISFFDNLLMSIKSSQIKEGGFFIIVGRKKNKS